MTLHTCKDQSEVITGGLGIRTVHLTPDIASVDLHEHAFDHVMFFAVGTATVTAHCPCGTINTHQVTAGDYLLIPATWKHGVVATSEVVKFHCVFPQYDATGPRGAQFMADTDGA